MMNNLINYWMVRMDDVSAYLLSATLVLTLLYAPYTLLLRKERFFRQNRFTLLAIMVLSLVLPFCDFHAFYPGELLPTLPTAPMVGVESDVPTPISVTATMEPMVITEVSHQPFRLLPWLSHLYIIGVLIMLVIRLWQFARMHRLIRRGCLWSDVEEGITIHCHADDVAPCSWMRHIVISEHDYRHHRHEILLHERGHVLCHHSWDILLLMLVQTIQWYNPFAYMLGASLRDVHEYEADDYVLRQGVTASEYQTLLLKTAINGGKYTFANNFNHCFIKNRIIMLKRKAFSPWLRMKVLFVLPAIVVAVIVISCISPKEEFPYPVRIGLNDVDLYKISDFGKRTTIHIVFDRGSMFNKGSMRGMPNPVEAFLSGKSEREELLAGFQLTEADIDSVQIYFPGECPFYDRESENGVLRIFTKRYIKHVISYNEHKNSPNIIDDIHITSSTSAIEVEEETETDIPTHITEWRGDAPYKSAGQNPEFPGGIEELKNFFTKNIRYPAKARKKGIEGRVMVRFAVNKDGSISRAQVMRTVDPLLENEVLRVISEMPRWTPGMINDEPVGVYVIVPIVFKIEQ